MKRRARSIVDQYSNEGSIFYTDLKVWFKNFDVFKKKNKFDLNPYQTTYSFNDCDLIINNDNIVLIGKSKILGKYRYLNPTVFISKEKKGNELVNSRLVNAGKVQENSGDLEIDFQDSHYKNTITLVIKRVDKRLVKKIKNVLQQ
ncbi:MAG: hypothetical protein MI922_18945 [Bacteroidales bacterium]|nr:hypothetical protein [Bacteroidales bacterium]